MPSDVDISRAKGTTICFRANNSPRDGKITDYRLRSTVDNMNITPCRMPWGPAERDDGGPCVLSSTP
ncbi:hypothetical protein IFM47457_06005 [Aspergillus lentulus]|nr:hypothetical protein IFM47457_06005 [Aspergillus lentulus]